VSAKPGETPTMLTYEQARQKVIDAVAASRRPPAIEAVSLEEALGRVLAQDVLADRDYPPFDRAIRDGYAVRAADAQPGAKLRCAGEIKAGDSSGETLKAGTCVQIMTGAAAPPGADAVVMIEHTQRADDFVEFDRSTSPGQHIVPRGSEARSGQTLLTPGTRLGYAELALAAQVGFVQAKVNRKPRVAILSTGDEVVLAASTPGPFQIRNSNSFSLRAQVSLLGAKPVLLGNAQDDEDDLRSKISLGLQNDLLILSGGVSMGKYDLVEPVLKQLGADFLFDAVAIRPGKPTVFARCGETFVFGLPGNPVSTMVTFELFVVPAVDLLSGANPRPLAFLEARLAEPLREKPGLAHFLPARLDWPHGMPEVRAIRWQGSGDIAAMAKSNCLLLVPSDKDSLNEGERVAVIPRRNLV
jgi:molybdopterin molybdotransferase